MSPVDVAALRRMAISEGGLLTDEIRCQVWPRLLNVAPHVFDQEPGIMLATLTLTLIRLKKTPGELLEIIENTNFPGKLDKAQSNTCMYMCLS